MVLVKTSTVRTLNDIISRGEMMNFYHSAYAAVWLECPPLNYAETPAVWFLEIAVECQADRLNNGH